MASSGGKFRIRKKKWNSMRAANRIPEVALELKLTDIRRHHGAFKRDLRLEEGRLWDYLYDEDQLLKQSLANYPLEDIMEGSVPLKRTWQNEREEAPAYSQRYREFIIFKANVMTKIFGSNIAMTRPRYADLYEKENAPRERNQKSYESLVEKCLSRLAEAERALEALGNDQNEAYDADDLQSELAEMEKRRRSRAGSRARVGHIHARPHHKRKQSKAIEVTDSKHSFAERDECFLPPGENEADHAQTGVKERDTERKASRLYLPPLLTSEAHGMLPKVMETKVESSQLPAI